MTDPDARLRATTDYVRAVTPFLGLTLGDARIARVAAQLARTHAMAETLQAFALDDHVEPAEIYQPAPFPDDEAGAARDAASGE